MNLGFIKWGRIGKNWTWETQLFAMPRSFRDGITFFKFNLNLDLYKSDHSPAFQIELTIMNLYFHLWIYTSKYAGIDE